MLRPGDRVDVQLFVKKDQRTGVETAKSKVILQNIRVFAVDQAVQRSADGGDEKAIAKTVSLMLSPEQASKLSLAEQIGEISLIPRNPDDEEAADWSEYTVDDLLSNGEKNSRDKEQGTSAKPATEEPTPNPSLVNAVNNSPKPVKEPFRMEVVEAQGVREVLFDGETGRIIHPTGEKPRAGGPTLNPSPGSHPDHDAAPSGDDAKMLEEFPIDFGGDKK